MAAGRARLGLTALRAVILSEAKDLLFILTSDSSFLTHRLSLITVFLSAPSRSRLGLTALRAVILSEAKDLLFILSPDS